MLLHVFAINSRKKAAPFEVTAGDASPFRVGLENQPCYRHRRMYRQRNRELRFDKYLHLFDGNISSRVIKTQERLGCTAMVVYTYETFVSRLKSTTVE